MTVRARGVVRIMVLPDYIVEAVDRLPGDDGWGQIRAYLDAGGDVNDVDANGKTILNRFLRRRRTIPCEASFELVRLLVQERGADVNKTDDSGRNAYIPRDAILDAYAKATNTNWHPDISGALVRQKRARQEREGI